MRAVNLVASHARRKKILKRAKGYYGAASRRIKTARDAVRRAMQYSYAHRRRRAGDFRRLWIVRINAACRANGISYSRFINALHKAHIEIDRKILAELAVNHPESFRQLVSRALQAITT